MSLEKQQLLEKLVKNLRNAREQRNKAKEDIKLFNAIPSKSFKRDSS